MLMLTTVYVEFLKLRRSKVVWVCLAAPFLVGLLFFLIQAAIPASEGPLDNPLRMWPFHIYVGYMMWAFFMLPMSATIIAAQLGQLEHGPKTWAHLFALPVGKWQIFLAKIVVCLLLVALMSLLLVGFMVLGGWLVGEIWASKKLVDPQALLAMIPQGALDSASQGGGGGDGDDPFQGLLGELLRGKSWRTLLAEKLGLIYVASFLLVGVQLWVSMIFRNFMIPVAVGMGGAFIAAIARAFKEARVFADYFPWFLPEKMLWLDQHEINMALWIGCYGGLAVFLLMLLHLNRMEIK